MSIFSFKKIKTNWLWFFMFFLMNSLYSFEIHPHGFWIGSGGHCHDSNLAKALVRFFKEERASFVMDFGCGQGDYLKVFKAHGIACQGFDGNPNTYVITQGLGSVLDLSVPVKLNYLADWVLSLEVGEHLPKQYETIFLENIHRHNKKGVVLSWAIKGQGGDGHFNEQDNDYIKARMADYGYTNDLAAEVSLRAQAILPWFKNTIMVFRKN